MAAPPQRVLPCTSLPGIPLPLASSSAGFAGLSQATAMPHHDPELMARFATANYTAGAGSPQTSTPEFLFRCKYATAGKQLNRQILFCLVLPAQQSPSQGLRGISDRQNPAHAGRVVGKLPHTREQSLGDTFWTMEL